ncbi:MAG TPA: translocation/assembly module TamB domain-containing protein, partial [Anaeromyxobacteraceae bacterium]|nr:translocation/assembly module TamB domain-containing protein [Anaeromyxobacteraceae bacterium]
ELGPVEVVATAGGGSVEVSRLQAAAPGGSVSGRLRWGETRAGSGELAVTAGNLPLLERNLATVLGRKLPRLEGSARASVTLSGTSRAPRLEANVEAPRIGVGSVGAEGALLQVSLVGPLSVASGEVKGGLARAHVAGLDLRAVRLDAALREEEVSLTFTANVPQVGTDPVRAVLRGKFGDHRSTFTLADALIAWPGTRFTLERPSKLDLSMPSVDRVALVADTQRLEAEGGVRRGGRLEGRLRLTGFDLARLPRGFVSSDAAPEGILTVDARASGTREAPHVEATVGVTSGSAFQVGGLELLGDVTWDGGLARIEADLGLVRARGGVIDVSLDLPVALADARESERLRVELHGKGVPLDELVWLAGSYALVSGDVDFTANLTGSVGSPELHASATVRHGSWEDLEELALEATADTPRDRLRVLANGSLGGAPAASLEGEVALELSRFLTRPRDAIAAARRAALSLTLRVPGLDLKRLAGRLDLPPDLAGRLGGEVAVGGSLASPRGTARISVDEVAALGARRVGGRIDVALAPERTGAIVDLRLAGSPAVRLDGTIELPAERLLDRGSLTAAPVRVDVRVARSELAAWGGEVASLGGWVEGKGSLRGTLGAPQATLSASASGAVVEGRPLGELTIEGRYAARRSTFGLDLRPPAGGALRADLAVDQPLGIGADAGPIRAAPAELRVRADRLDLGFLPALAPGVVRVASGVATLDLTAAGALAELRPQGTLRVAKGRLAIAELGEWTDATIEADLGADTVELRRFDVRKGSGSASLHGALRGLARRGVPAEVEATLHAQDFGIERAGMELARLDLTAEARGQLDRDGLTLGVVIPQAEVKLPKRVPRTLQETGTRRDITVGRPKPQRSRRGAPAAAASASAAAPAAAPSEPFRAVVHVVAPRRFRVRADQPRIDVELKADAIFAFAGSRSEATGSIQSIRGHVEPIGGRVFVLERGKVTFTGGPVETGTLDLAARYENPTTVVHATVGGTVRKPALHLSSEPPMQEAQIAMLVATGRAEVRPGTESINTLAAGEAGLAAAGAVATGVFKDLLSDKLPVDSVSLDSTAVRAGKYLTDRVYVGYVRRFDAKPEKGENPDEVRVDYQLAPGWQVETRYGTGQSGSASIVWSRNY